MYVYIYIYTHIYMLRRSDTPPPGQKGGPRMSRQGDSRDAALPRSLQKGSQECRIRSLRVRSLRMDRTIFTDGMAQTKVSNESLSQAECKVQALVELLVQYGLICSMRVLTP